MRNLFLLLLLANLGFLGWSLWIAPPDVAPDRLPGHDSEADLTAAGPRPESASMALNAAQQKQGAGPRCFRIGPLVDGQLADMLRSSLNGRGVRTGMTTEEGQVWVGHWVQLEQFSSRQEADQIAARLAAGGLPDAYVLQAVPPFSISLGVFRDRARADNVVSQASRLGFKPRITDRFRAGLQYWLTAEMRPGEDLSLEDLGKESGQILRAEPMSCGSGANGATRPD